MDITNPVVALTDISNMFGLIIAFICFGLIIIGIIWIISQFN